MVCVWERSRSVREEGEGERARGVTSEGGQTTQRVRETTCEGERDTDCQRQRARGVMSERGEECERMVACRSQRTAEARRERRERENE